MTYISKLKSKTRRGYYIVSNYTTRIIKNNSTRVAIVSSDIWKNRVFDDLLLQKALIRRGYNARIISWQDRSIDWRKFDALIIASMWGYQNYLSDFKEWLRNMSESGYAVFNSTEIIENNYDKVKQIKLLDDDDIPHIKTKIVSRDINSELTKMTYPYVVKPTVSGSGENTFLVRDKNDLEHYLPRMQRIIEKRELLVQPFIDEIREGEMSVIAINGKLSHAVKRFPGVLDKKGYRVEYISLESLEADLIKLCERIIRIPRYRNCLYLRMDTVRIKNKIYMMELELFEPQLFYYLLPTPQREKAFDEIWKYLKEHIH